MNGDFLGQKLGPLPLVAWVGLAAGTVAIAMALRGRAQPKGSSIDMLAPSAAEAFGTLEEQQRELTGALTQLGVVQDQLQQGQQGLLGGLRFVADQNVELRNQNEAMQHNLGEAIAVPRTGTLSTLATG